MKWRWCERTMSFPCSASACSAAADHRFSSLCRPCSLQLFAFRTVVFMTDGRSCCRAIGCHVNGTFSPLYPLRVARHPQGRRCRTHVKSILGIRSIGERSADCHARPHSPWSMFLSCFCPLYCHVRPMLPLRPAYVYSVACCVTCLSTRL